MMDPIQSEIHRRVLTLLARGQADQDTLAARLSPAERAAQGELHAWSPKDHVAHNNFWRRDAIRRLQAALDGSEPPDTEQDETQTLLWNDRVFQEKRETPWEQLVAETQRLRAETAALIERVSPDDLSQRDRYPWQRGGSLETLILVNWYDHPAEHWSDIYLSRQEIDRALELRQAVAATVRDLFGHESKLYSYMVYKLGGLYARDGRAEQAIGAIREALSVNPSLGEWVRQDTDLDALRALPEFQALYAS
jgi:tetratricopeptide (TPR) repeat protein